MVCSASHRFGAIDDDRKAMGEPGRPKAAVVLTFDERSQLDRWARQPPEDAPSLALHSSIVLQCAAGYTNRDVAQDLDISERTVSEWRGRFVARRLEGLHDLPRPGLPPSITEDQVDSLIFATLQGRPDGTPWTRESMAKFIGFSASSVGRYWKEHGLNPHRVNIVALSADPKFVGKVRDVVGLCLHPPQVAFVLCVDETVEIPAARRVSPMVLRPEMAQGGGDDQRSAPTELYGALEAASQQVIADPALATTTDRSRDLQFQRFLEGIAESVPKDLDLHVVVEHSATKMTEPLREWWLDHQQFEFHTTPTYGWWLTLAEWWFAGLANQGLGRPTGELGASIRDWIERWNKYSRPFDWHKSADEIVYMLFPADV